MNFKRGLNLKISNRRQNITTEGVNPGTVSSKITGSEEAGSLLTFCDYDLEFKSVNAKMQNILLKIYAYVALCDWHYTFTDEL